MPTKRRKYFEELLQSWKMFQFSNRYEEKYVLEEEKEEKKEQNREEEKERDEKEEEETQEKEE